MRIIGYDDDAYEMDNDDDLDNEGREGAMLMVEGGIRDADTNWDAQEADLEVQIFSADSSTHCLRYSWKTHFIEINSHFFHGHFNLFINFEEL